MRKNRPKDASELDDGDVTDDSFRNPNLSIIPEDASTKMAAALPETRVKAGMQPNSLKIVNRRNPQNRVQANLQEGDLQKLANAVTMEINNMAAQLFELISMLNEVIS